MRSRPLVLNVDDDRAGRYAVGRNLKQAGYDVRDAGTGLEALRLVPELGPDLVLLDVRLPDIDGFEVCRRIREQPSDIAATPVIHMSASYVDTKSKVKGLETGADAYLTEPVEPPILIATIESVLRMRRAQQEIRRSSAHWQITFNAIRDGVALFGPDGALLRSNECYDRLLAFDPDLIRMEVGRNFERARSELRRQCADITAGAKTLLLTLDPVLTGGAFDGAACVLADVTEKNRFEADLRQTAKLESIGVLAGGIAHDFNNLLTGIIGCSSLLREMVAPHSEQRDLIDQVLKSSQSAADLTRQILAYAGRGRFVKAPVNLTRVALETRSLVRRFIPPGVDLVIETDPDLPWIEGDPGQMQQIVMNLVINAGESFGEEPHGSVVVGTAVADLDESFFAGGENPAPGRYVVLTVSDNGSGMSDETQRRIFEPFFTTKFTGRGLGLSAVHGILRSHGGYLRLESAVGAGTTFRVYLPIAAVENPTTPAPDADLTAGTRATVLFVDDEAAIRKVAKLTLQKRGYEVLLAQDGAEAVEVFRRHAGAISVILLDYAMPVMDGEQAFHAIRDLSPSVPIVLSSGFSRSVVMEKFNEQEIAGFLGKPYSAQQIAEAVAAALTVSLGR